jgi:hypothetical protein
VPGIKVKSLYGIRGDAERREVSTHMVVEGPQKLSLLLLCFFLLENLIYIV